MRRGVHIALLLLGAVYLWGQPTEAIPFELVPSEIGTPSVKGELVVTFRNFKKNSSERYTTSKKGDADIQVEFSFSGKTALLKYCPLKIKISGEDLDGTVNRKVRANGSIVNAVYPKGAGATKLLVQLRPEENAPNCTYNLTGGQKTFYLDRTAPPSATKSPPSRDAVSASKTKEKPTEPAEPSAPQDAVPARDSTEKASVTNDLADVRTNTRRDTTADAITEPPKPDTTGMPPWVYWGIGALFLLILIGIFIARSRSSGRSNKSASSVAPLTAAEPESPILEEPSTDEPPPAIPLQPATLGEPKAGQEAFTISRREKDQRGRSFGLLRAPRDYNGLRMAQLWEDSVLTQLYLHWDCIRAIDDFLRAYNAPYLEEQEGDVPEIGGMLMGTHRERAGRYEVTVDRFVPIRSAFQDRYQLAFSATSLAEDLGLIQNQYPELSLVGWFHTHPGHGLFLSKPDLRIQEGFFRQPYQFAMEIDSLSANLDTGFFTWRTSGDINNTLRGDEVLPWFSWPDIVAAHSTH